MRLGLGLFIVLLIVAGVGAWLGYQPVSPEVTPTNESAPTDHATVSKETAKPPSAAESASKMAEFLKKGGLEKIEKTHAGGKFAQPFDATVDAWKTHAAERKYDESLDYLSPYIPSTRPGNAVMIILTINRTSGGTAMKEAEFVRESKQYLLNNAQPGLAVIRDALQKMPVHDENAVDRNQLLRLAEFVIFNHPQESNPDIEELYDDIKRFAN